MCSLTTALLLGLVTSALCSAIPPKDDHSKRVKEQHISEHEHFDPEGHHNAEYDHDAFLGEDDAKEFDKLSPEESERRLGIIYDKIDADKNGEVTKDELTQWIVHVQNKYLETDANRQWDEIGVTGDLMSWEIYRRKSYGGLDDFNMANSDSEEFTDAVKMERRDKKRFSRADKNLDGSLDRKEFNEFIHPEESKDMRDLVVDETMEDIDKDGDGFISLEEYIGDMWTPTENGHEPDWVERERTNFKEQRDKDQDGKLNTVEVTSWIMPEDYDHMAVEAKHLLREADVDKDGVLTKQEVLSKHDLFVGSQATDYGDALQRHDEF